MKTKNTPSNIPTARLRMKMLEFVCKYDYYPMEWLDLNDTHEEMMSNKISIGEYNDYVEMLSKTWDVK